MWDPFAEFEKTTLPNGLDVYASEWPGRSWQAIGFLVHSGAKHDPVGLEGLAHFVEHLVFENGEKTLDEISSYFTEKGGFVNTGSTSYHRTNYKCFLPAKIEDVACALQICGETLIGRKLSQLVERERKIIIEEFNRSFPSDLATKIAFDSRKTIYGDFWLSRFLIPLGEPRTINLISKDHLQSFYDNNYTPANISLVGIGGLSIQQFFGLINDSPFSQNVIGVRNEKPEVISNFPPPKSNLKTLSLSELIKGESRNTASISCKAVIPGTINSSAVTFLSQMISHILNKEVREKHAWTYHINSAWVNLHEIFEFSIDCRSIAQESLPHIERIIEKCLNEIKDEDALFRQIKVTELNRLSLLDQSGYSCLKNAMSDITFTGRIITLSELLHSVKELSFENVIDILKFLNSDRRFTTIITP